MQKRGKKKEELHASEHIAKAHTPAHAKGHKVLGLVNLALGCKEAAGLELGRLLPEILVHVYGVQKGDDLRARGYCEAVQADLAASTGKETCCG